MPGAQTYAWHPGWAKGRVALLVPSDKGNIRTLSPKQARAYARKILKAADTAERHQKKRGGC